MLTIPVPHTNIKTMIKPSKNTTRFLRNSVIIVSVILIVLLVVALAVFGRF
jgi:hypothetical protein